MALSSSAVRTMFRPIRPKPLIPTLIGILPPEGFRVCFTNPEIKLFRPRVSRFQRFVLANPELKGRKMETRRSRCRVLNHHSRAENAALKSGRHRHANRKCYGLP